MTPNGTSAFPDTITDLHCFDENIHELDYYRPCEKAVRDIEIKYSSLENFVLRDYYVIPSTKDLPICTPDGNFAKLQIDGSSSTYFCSGKFH